MTRMRRIRRSFEAMALLPCISAGISTPRGSMVECNGSQGGPGRRGFTMVELLVVIGIIVVLIAMLMPALGKARQAAQATMCTSGVRQIALGWVYYASENRGFLPASWDGPSNTSWADRMDPYISKISAKSIYVCPSAVPPEDISHQFPLTYGMNCSVFVYRSSTAQSLVKITSVTRPSEILGVADCAQSSGVFTCGGWISGSDIWYNAPSQANNYIAINNTDTGDYHVRFRHNAQLYAGAAFLDGHAEQVRIGTLQYKNFSISY